jgi:hypothetical protein
MKRLWATGSRVVWSFGHSRRAKILRRTFEEVNHTVTVGSDGRLDSRSRWHGIFEHVVTLLLLLHLLNLQQGRSQRQRLVRTLHHNRPVLWYRHRLVEGWRRLGRLHVHGHA